MPFKYDENGILNYYDENGKFVKAVDSFMIPTEDKQKSDDIEEEDFGWYDEETIGKLSATQEGKELIANAPEMAKEELEQAIKKYLGK